MAELTKQQAYFAMFALLSKHYSRTGSDDIAVLLSDLSLLPDGAPADPGVKDDWEKAVSDAIAGRVSATSKIE